MKILHTADWHIGKRLGNFSRLPEQRLALQEICNLARREAVDLVLIAGDLFDAFHPPTEALQLFYETVTDLSHGGRRPVIAIAGNHDSAALIDAPHVLAHLQGIFMIGHPRAVVTGRDQAAFSLTKSLPGLLELKLAHCPYPVRVLHTAFANEGRLKAFLGEDKQAGLNELLHDHWHTLAAEHLDEHGVNLLITHLYMNRPGSELLEEPEGERALNVGTADLVWTTAIPPQVQYAALGHLHRYQNLGTEERPIVYSSSLLRYSFSEAGQTRHAVIIDAEPGRPMKMTAHPLTGGHALERPAFEQVDAAVSWLKAHPEALVELTLATPNYLSAADRQALYAAHDRLLFLIPKLTGQGQTTREKACPQLDLNQNIDALFRQYFQHKHGGQTPGEDLMRLFHEVLNTPA